MKITKADIQKVVREEITASSQKDAQNFPTTDRDWERFKQQFDEKRSAGNRQDTKSTQRSPFLNFRNLMAVAAALGAVALLTTLQAPQSTLRFAKADTYRGENPDAPVTNAPLWIAEQQLDIQWKLTDQTISFPLLDGTILHGKLVPAPELNLNDEISSRFFRVTEASTTLRTGDSLEAKGTLQIRASSLATLDEVPKSLAEVQSALLKLKLIAKDGRSQDLWYEFKK